jgi:hypothetical protein
LVCRAQRQAAAQLEPPAHHLEPLTIAESARIFDIYGPEDTARFAKELLAIVAPPAPPEQLPLEPVFAKTLDIEQQIRACRAEHAEWDHRQIGKAVKRAASVVARVLNETVAPDSLEARIARARAQSAGKKKIALRVANLGEMVAAQRLLKDRPGGELIKVEAEIPVS